MSVSSKINLLLVKDEISGNLSAVTVPFNKANVGDLVQFAMGSIGEVIACVEWIEPESDTVKFVEKIVDVCEAEKVWHTSYEKKEEDVKDGN